jgi:hypothetical protein
MKVGDTCERADGDGMHGRQITPSELHSGYREKDGLVHRHDVET